MRLATVALFAVPVLAGCAHHNMMWVKDGATQADFDRDRAQCIYESAAATGSYNPSGSTARSTGGAIAQGIGDGIAIGLRRQEIAILCMQARGYRQVPIGTAGVVPAVATDSASPAPPYPVQPATYSDPRANMNAPVEPPKAAPPQAGPSAFTVERMAREQACHDQPVARLVTTGAGFETYTVSCKDGDALSLRCEIGNCRVLK